MATPIIVMISKMGVEPFIFYLYGIDCNMLATYNKDTTVNVNERGERMSVSPDHFRSYVELFSQFYKEGKVGAKWGRSQVYFRPTVDLEEELHSIDSSYSEEEFVDVAFEVLRVVRELSNGVSSKRIDEQKIQIISEIFLPANEGILEHVRIRSTSLINTLEEIDFEITTKRSKEDPNHITGTSVVLSLVYNDPMKPESNHRFALELSNKELKEIVKVLEEALDTIKKIDS